MFSVRTTCNENFCSRKKSKPRIEGNSSAIRTFFEDIFVVFSAEIERGRSKCSFSLSSLNRYIWNGGSLTCLNLEPPKSTSVSDGLCFIGMCNRLTSFSERYELELPVSMTKSISVCGTRKEEHSMTAGRTSLPSTTCNAILSLMPFIGILQNSLYLADELDEDCGGVDAFFIQVFQQDVQIAGRVEYLLIVECDELVVVFCDQPAGAGLEPKEIAPSGKEHLRDGFGHAPSDAEGIYMSFWGISGRITAKRQQRT